MKWIIVLLVSVAMFFAGYHHAARYITDEVDDTDTPASHEAAEDSAES